MAALSGCVSIARVDSGTRTLGARMEVSIDGAWNHVSAPNSGPAETWTMDGLPIDQLLLYSGLKDGESVHARDANSQTRRLEFRATMQPDEIVALFEGMLTRDGSRFRLVRLEPMRFAGQDGFRFEYALTRKLDNVQLLGVGYGAVSKGELFAVVYMAPRLAFFERQRQRVERIAHSARLKD
jgi:hypothetical protein